MGYNEKEVVSMNVKRLTIINLCFSLLAWGLFIFNQFCKPRFWGLWQAWNLSGYAFIFAVGPLSAVFSVICVLISCDRLHKGQRFDKFLLVNGICTAATALLLLGSFVLPNTWTWN